MSAGPRVLSTAVHARIAAACERGDALAARAELEAALREFRLALGLVPEPVEEWEASTWILVAAGDMLFQLGRYEAARETLRRATRCPGGLGNPFLHLRLGQVYYHLGEHAAAADELARAYMGAGAEIFEGEDPSYLTLLSGTLRGV